MLLTTILLLVLFFVGLIFILRRILTQNVASATQHLEELNRDYLKKEETVNKLLEDTKQKSEELLTRSQKEADAFKVKTIQEAQEERERILKGARQQSEEMIQQAENARQQLLLEMEQRIAKEAVQRAVELIQLTLPEEFKRMVHRQWVEDLIESGFFQAERLHLPQELSEVKVVSAFALQEEQRKKISKKLKEVLGRDIDLREEVDPRLIAGLVITLGSLVLEGSFKNKIQEKVR